MKFLRRDTERDTFEGRPQSKRVIESLRESGPPPPPPPPPEPVVNIEPQVVAPPKPAPQPSSITSQTPENVIGETLVVQGRIEFQNLLRIDGHFEGELVGNGSLIIGPTAEVISNLRGLQEVYVEGILIGDCVCEKMQIRYAGCVTGNLQCASLGMDPSVVLKGRCTVMDACHQGSANVNPRDKTDKTERSKARNAPRHGRQRSQPRLSSDENSSSRTSHSSTSGLSPDSVVSRAPAFEDDNGSAMGDEIPVSNKHGGYDESNGKSGKVHQKSKSSRSSRSSINGGSHGGASGDISHGSHRRIPSNESLSQTVDDKSGGNGGVVPRLGDAVNMPVRVRPPVHGTK